MYAKTRGELKKKLDELGLFTGKHEMIGKANPKRLARVMGAQTHAEPPSAQQHAGTDLQELETEPVELNPRGIERSQPAAERVQQPVRPRHAEASGRRWPRSDDRSIGRRATSV